jgi:hypothetical protein
VIGCVEKGGDLIEGTCAVAGVISPDNGVDRVVDEVSFDREAEFRNDIIANFEIVTDSGVEDRFAIDRLIAESGAPWLKKVYTDSSTKDGAFVRTIKVLK